jgi:hypothetical protein
VSVRGSGADLAGATQQSLDATKSGGSHQRQVKRRKAEIRDDARDEKEPGKRRKRIQRMSEVWEGKDEWKSGKERGKN